MAKRLTNEEVILRFKEKHGELFDYSKVNYTKSNDKVEIICRAHGSFWQLPFDHMKGIGCQQCGRELAGTKKRKDTNWFIEKSKEIHGDLYDYSLVEYIKSNTHVKIICPIHGIFEQLAHQHFKTSGCEKCSYDKRADSMTRDTETFVIKAKEIHGERYDYSKVDYIKGVKKIEIICKKHGSFLQTPHSHTYFKSGCPECGKELIGNSLRKTTEQFIEDAVKIHGNKYDYSNSIYTNSHDTIIMNCPTHGSFSMKAYEHVHKNGRGCPKCSSWISQPEIFIENILKQYNIQYEKNNRTLLNGLELDFYIPDKKLAIEYNGLYYHSEVAGNKDKHYHLHKTDECEKLGIKLIHIFEDEFLTNEKLIRSKIKNLIGVNKYKIYARKCEIRTVDDKTKKNFLNKYHVQKNSQSSINIGLYYKHKLVQLMTFSKRRTALGYRGDSKNEYELSRMCSINGFNIIGGASKLLNFFKKTYSPINIISYADRRWSSGGVYDNLGFKKTHISKPNYWYLKLEKNNNRQHRYNFCKHVLSKKLNIYNPNISEWENMKLNGYDRVWDCGNIVYDNRNSTII